MQLGRPGRGRGGFQNYNAGGQGYQMNNTPTNTLNIRVSSIRQPVTEEVMRRVFDSAAVSAQSVQVLSTANPTEVTVIARFPDAYAAERVMRTLNNRNIFNDSNKMTMTYTRGSVRGMAPDGGSAVLPTPLVPPAPMYPSNPSPYASAPPPPAVYQPPPPVMPAAPGGFPARGPGNVMGGGPPPPLAGYGAPVAGLQPNMPPAVGRGAPRGRGGRGIRGGRGGYGYAGGGFDPTGGAVAAGGYPPMPYGMMPMVGYPGMQGGIMPLQPPINPRQMHNNTVYLSVTSVPEGEPLQSIFTLMEAFGGIVSIRRNHAKKEILTARASSVEDAGAIVHFMRRVPFAGVAVSAKRFPSYVERHPCTDDGDPLDPATVQFDFTAARHRSPGQRSKCHPSTLLKVTGCSGYHEVDLMNYFNNKQFYPYSITMDDDGAFLVQVADVETAVKLLIACHNNVCGEERSNVLFLEGPRNADNGDFSTDGNEQGAAAMTETA